MERKILFRERGNRKMKKVYGIDLGTTNSLIGNGDKLYSKIDPTTGKEKFLVASIANMQTKEAGNDLKNVYTDSIQRSFKCNMSMGPEGTLSIEASAYVLNELKTYVTDDDVEDVIITVPAYFTDNNRQAVRRAAEKCNLNVIRLINEPTAAATLHNRDKKALTLVYDLGGGTFDVSLVDNRMGYYEVVTTDGKSIGGDDLDRAIVEEVLNVANVSKHRMREGDRALLKDMCERAKIAIQKTGNDYIMSLSLFKHTGCNNTYTLTADRYKQLVLSVFSDTFKITDRIRREYIPEGELYDLILVGGSSRDPYITQLMFEKIDMIPEPITYNPDELVGRGAAYCAELAEQGKLDDMIADIVSSPIGIGMADMTVKHLILKDAHLPISEMRPFTNPEDSQQLLLSVYQGNSKLVANSQLLGEMKYDYGEVVEAGQGLVNVRLSVDRDGIISLSARHGRKKEQKIVLDRKIDITREK